MDARGGFLGEAVDAGDELGAQIMDHVGQVAAVIEDHVELGAIGPLEGLLDTPVELFRVHALPREDGDAGLGDGGGGVVLGGEDVAGGPADFRSEVNEGLDEHGGLNGHVKAAGDLGSLEGELALVLGAQRHETRHFVFRDGDFLAAVFGQGDVFYFVVVAHVRMFLLFVVRCKLFKNSVILSLSKDQPPEINAGGWRP